MPKKTQKRMTKAQFNAILPLLKNISEDRRRAAYLNMVEGKTFSEAAEPFNWSRQSAYQAAKAVWAVFERYSQAQSLAADDGTMPPPGWEKVTLVAPTTLLEDFRAAIAEAAANLPSASADPVQSPVPAAKKANVKSSVAPTAAPKAKAASKPASKAAVKKLPAKTKAKTSG